jgi:hypothetical protein
LHPPAFPPAERLKRARLFRERLWKLRLSEPEDDRIDELVDYCTALCGGDAMAGGSLATEALWS